MAEHCLCLTFAYFCLMGGLVLPPINQLVVKPGYLLSSLGRGASPRSSAYSYSIYLLPDSLFSSREIMDSALATMTPEELANYPARAPPEGVQSNFGEAENNTKPMIVVLSTFFAIMLMFFSNRIYVKSCIVRRFSWDDRKLLEPTLSLIALLTSFIVTISLAVVSLRNHWLRNHLSCAFAGLLTFSL